MRILYSVVRFVPDPARGEFVNVGAIAGSEESSEWQVRQIDNPKRARTIDEHKVLDAVWSFFNEIGHQIDEHEKALSSLSGSRARLSEEWLHRLYAEHQNIVQLGPPTPMVASSVDEAMDIIFEQMIVDPVVGKRGLKTKHAALAAVRRAYREYMIPKEAITEGVVLLSPNNYRQRFDFAIVNHRTLQLTHTWSFQVSDQETIAAEVKAWAWTVEDVRSSTGGTIVEELEGGQVEVPSSVDIQVVFIPPAEGQNSLAMREAERAFDKLGVSSVEISGAGLVGARARELIKRADGS